MRRRVPLGWSNVWAVNTTAIFHPATQWLPASDVKSIRGAMEMQLRESDQEASLAYQTANVENNADSATAVGSYSTSNGVAYPSPWEDMSAYTEQKQLIRFGWLVKNTSGSTRTWSRVGGFMEISDS